MKRRELEPFAQNGPLAGGEEMLYATPVCLPMCLRDDRRRQLAPERLV
jgi:hypothetical protein